MSLSEEISIKFEGGVFLQYYKLSPNSGEICHLAKLFLGGKFTSVEFANQILRISFTIKIKTHVKVCMGAISKSETKANQSNKVCKISLRLPKNVTCILFTKIHRGRSNGSMNI